MRALELGVNDFLTRPIDAQELKARVRTQVRRKRYNDELRQSLTETIEMAVTDGLTGLHNRRYHGQPPGDAVRPVRRASAAAVPDDHRPRPLQGHQRHIRP